MNKKIMSRLARHIVNETSVFHPRLMLAQLLMAPFPPFFGSSLRAHILRLVGFHIGPHSSIWGTPTIVGAGNIYNKLIIGSGCYIGIQAYFDMASSITLQDNVVLGPQTMFLTGTHHIGAAHNRAGDLVPKPICVGSGVWLGARCTVLPGVTIGDGAVIAAGSVVTRDIPRNSLAAGVPAVVKREILEENK